MLPDNLSLALTILVGSFSLAFFRFMHSLWGKTTPKTEDEAHAPHRAAIVFLDNLLIGIPEENEKIQVAIDCLLPVREFIESDESPDRRIDRTEPNLDVEEARLTVVEALYGFDSQRELIRENLRLKGGLFYLEKAAELLGSVELTFGGGHKATLSLRDGKMMGGWWLLMKDLETSFADLDSVECVVSGVPLQPTSEETDGNGIISKRFSNGASLHLGNVSWNSSITRVLMFHPFDSVTNVLNVLGIYGSEDA